MTTILLSVVVVGACAAAMAVGLLWKKPLQGSCGGASGKRADMDCPACGGDPAKCERESPTSASSKS
ncbi:MAG: hypothetical protein AUJ52_03930 [Elusimicrobia bacterium CG1_02_63_36]|nr:MAG: hypothetical protein AUJ52_03930 [Elusimicrobia bacterium CG1_02_63_36]PIP81540.1 MAG: ApbE family protein [Elusimicrobia bacterium CG22_combo_CG10-13_8_21_14_all_63_91]PJA14906.1 MAG: ApbE family protein [Elusimicrobia bacterium CG_4_10_14_0_2_um_filter_63_34]PJB25988.1 MAG: ApbE family protein [Elusimicrobia bacterium CG_4_9_14_3_um_filter_62_55]